MSQARWARGATSLTSSSLSYTLTHSPSRSLSLPHTHQHTLSPSHTHAHSLALSLPHSLPLSLSLSLSVGRRGLVPFPRRAGREARPASPLPPAPPATRPGTQTDPGTPRVVASRHGYLVRPYAIAYCRVLRRSIRIRLSTRGGGACLVPGALGERRDQPQLLRLVTRFSRSCTRLRA